MSSTDFKLWIKWAGDQGPRLKGAIRAKEIKFM